MDVHSPVKWFFIQKCQSFDTKLAGKRFLFQQNFSVTGFYLQYKMKRKILSVLALRDVQMSPGGQGLELRLGSYLVLIWSPWGCCPRTEHSTPQSRVCRKGHCGSALWVSHSSIPCAQPPLLPSDIKGGYSEGWGGNHSPSTLWHTQGNADSGTSAWFLSISSL